jgi:hypothetical protein
MKRDALRPKIFAFVIPQLSKAETKWGNTVHLTFPSPADTTEGSLALGDRLTTGNEQCSICFGKFGPVWPDNPVMSHCKHIFCTQCIFDWFRFAQCSDQCSLPCFRPPCPVCREPLVPVGSSFFWPQARTVEGRQEFFEKSHQKLGYHGF